MIVFKLGLITWVSKYGIRHSKENPQRHTLINNLKMSQVLIIVDIFKVWYNTL